MLQVSEPWVALAGDRPPPAGGRASGTRGRSRTWHDGAGAGRRAEGLRVTCAIRHLGPTQAWAPYALGVELSFWLKELVQWQRILPRRRPYERVQAWEAPQRQRAPGTDAVLLARLEATLEALAATTPPQDSPRWQCPAGVAEARHAPRAPAHGG